MTENATDTPVNIGDVVEYHGPHSTYHGPAKVVNASPGYNMTRYTLEFECRCVHQPCPKPQLYLKYVRRQSFTVVNDNQPVNISSGELVHVPSVLSPEEIRVMALSVLSHIGDGGGVKRALTHSGSNRVLLSQIYDYIRTGHLAER